LSPSMEVFMTLGASMTRSRNSTTSSEVGGAMDVKTFVWPPLNSLSGSQLRKAPSPVEITIVRYGRTTSSPAALGTQVRRRCT